MSIEVFFNRPARPLPIQRLCDEITASTERLGVACAWFTLTNVADAIIASKAKEKIVVFSAADLSRNNGVGQKCYDRIRLASMRTQGSFNVSTLGSGDWQEGIMHNKFVVIDRAVVWTGSYNLTYQAAKNYETLMRITDEDLADSFWEEVRRLAFEEHRLWQGMQFSGGDSEGAAFRCSTCEKIKPITEVEPGDERNSYMRCRLCVLLGPNHPLAVKR